MHVPILLTIKSNFLKKNSVVTIFFTVTTMLLLMNNSCLLHCGTIHRLSLNNNGLGPNQWADKSFINTFKNSSRWINSYNIQAHPWIPKMQRYARIRPGRENRAKYMRFIKHLGH